MKAIYYTEHGGPEVLQYGDLDAPVVGPGEVAIDVRATSLNHIDVFMRAGLPGITIPFPMIPGCDASGVIAEVGAGVSEVAVGDRVLINPSLTCGHCEFCLRGDVTLCRTYGLIGETQSGCCCERIVVPARNAVVFPDDMSFEDAASIPLVFTTAWRMLITRARLKPAEDILILGASAGVGIACIQVAKATGARVFAAAGTNEKLAMCEGLGADVLINYNEEDFAKRIRKETGKRGVDVVVDYVGQETWPRSIMSLARGGRLVTCGATTGYQAETDLRHVFFRQLELIGSTMGSHNDLLSALRLIFAGKMKPVVGHVYDLKDTAKAHIEMENRETIGKTVIRVSS